MSYTAYGAKFFHLHADRSCVIAKNTLVFNK